VVQFPGSRLGRGHMKDRVSGGNCGMHCPLLLLLLLLLLLAPACRGVPSGGGTSQKFFDDFQGKGKGQGLPRGSGCSPGLLEAFASGGLVSLGAAVRVRP
jgi:hypothetical protein